MKINKNKIYNLSVDEAYKLLSSKKMAKNKCNIEIYTDNSTAPGNNHGGRKRGSKNKMTVESLNKKLDLSIKSINTKIDKLSSIVEQLAKEVHEGFAKQEQFNQYVVDMFKRDKVFQDHVEDVFKRNNLK